MIDWQLGILLFSIFLLVVCVSWTALRHVFDPVCRAVVALSVAALSVWGFYGSSKDLLAVFLDYYSSLAVVLIVVLFLRWIARAVQWSGRPRKAVQGSRKRGKSAFPGCEKSRVPRSGD